MSSVAFETKNQRSRKNNRKLERQERFISMPNSKSSLLSEIEMITIKEEMENLNHSDESNFSQNTLKASRLGQNQLSSDELLKEENYDGKSLFSIQKRGIDRKNSR